MSYKTEETPRHRGGSSESSSDFVTLVDPLQPHSPRQAPDFPTCRSLCNTPSQPGSVPPSYWVSPTMLGFPDSSVGKESTCNVGHPGSIPGLGRSPGEGKGCPLQYSWASLVAQQVENPPAMWDTRVQSLGWEDPLEKGKATHFSILA